jgi:transcriptional regulator with XRE-family HTH domain
MSNTSTDRIIGEILREWRVSQQLEISELANSASLSVAQIQQLESGGVSLFYSASIKENAARKVAHILGGNPDSVIRSQDGQFFLEDSSVIEELVDLSREKSQTTLTTLLIFRHTFLITILVSALIVAIASFGWVQKKWQSGGAEQFWRETVMTSSSESVTLLEPELIELRTLTQSTSVANRFVFKAN